jgi:hypothetical protein
MVKGDEYNEEHILNDLWTNTSKQEKPSSFSMDPLVDGSVGAITWLSRNVGCKINWEHHHDCVIDMNVETRLSCRTCGFPGGDYEEWRLL